MLPEDKLSDDFSEIEIIDLPEEDGEAAEATIIGLPTKKGHERWDQHSIVKEHHPSLTKSSDIAINGKRHTQKRKINRVLMAITILSALFLLNSAGGSLLIGKMLNTITNHFRPPEKKIAQQNSQLQVQATNNDLLSMLLRATPPGPTPANCLSNTNIKGQQNSLVQHPLTIFGFRGPQAQVHLKAIQTVKATKGDLSAWGTQLVLQLDARDPPSVWLHLSNLSGGSDPIFGYRLDGIQEEPAMSAANGTDAANIVPSPSTLYLNPQRPDQNYGAAWSVGSNTWVTNIYFNDAGCYKLTAGWPDGHWEINFASGV